MVRWGSRTYKRVKIGQHYQVCIICWMCSIITLWNRGGTCEALPERPQFRISARGNDGREDGMAGSCVCIGYCFI